MYKEHCYYCLYRLIQQRFPTLGLYLKFGLYRIPVYSKFGLNRLRCTSLKGVLRRICLNFQPIRKHNWTSSHAEFLNETKIIQNARNTSHMAHFC